MKMQISANRPAVPAAALRFGGPVDIRQARQNLENYLNASQVPFKEIRVVGPFMLGALDPSGRPGSGGGFPARLDIITGTMDEAREVFRALEQAPDVRQFQGEPKDHATLAVMRDLEKMLKDKGMNPVLSQVNGMISLFDLNNLVSGSHKEIAKILEDAGAKDVTGQEYYKLFKYQGQTVILGHLSNVGEGTYQGHPFSVAVLP